MVLTSKNYAQSQGLKPLARIVGQTSYAGEPHLFTTAPVYAIQKLIKQCDWNIDQVDLFEINEAFASQVLSCLKGLGIDFNDPRVNPNGGAIAVGHPLGASGARLALTVAREFFKICLKFLAHKY